VDPTRPGTITGLVNAVSREVSADVADWRLGRLLMMSGQMEREARERDQNATFAE